MFKYFQAVVDDESIFIVKVKIGRVSPISVEYAKRKAKEIVKQELNTDDFEIKELTIASLLSQLTFVNGIAELIPITKP